MKEIKNINYIFKVYLNGTQTETQTQTVDLFWYVNEIQEPCHRRRRSKMGSKTQPQMPLLTS
jgi:hypothetical protein